MNDDLPHDFIPTMDKFWGRLFSNFDGEALNARDAIKNYLTKCKLHPSDVVVAPRDREKLAASLVLHLEKYEHEKSRCEELESLIEELESLVAELRTQLDSQRVTVTKHKHYKPSDEDAKPWSKSASLVYEHYPPDRAGNVPYSIFLIALLAKRNWRTQDAHQEFARLADIEQQAMAHWRERGHVPYEYYMLIGRLPFGTVPRAAMKWTPVAIATLREHFSADLVLSDTAIAKAMNRKLGCSVSGHAVHCKAQELGLLRGTKRARQSRRDRRTRTASPRASSSASINK